ncbi:keratin, type II cytoskeletal 2 epidermal-like [Benincasa hispida]|uniref:keratin, type II cytoskeletal 2 epidermal-like n=1 Tax=Benincasa hispida TaxID=102211 RepID=UPI0018FF18B5|nr:keratin, type II cytoskeletal 2 epidermal-like [Benincasa hispida]
MFETIVNAETSKAAWDKLQLTHRGANRVKKVRLQTLRGEFESLQMKETEVIAEYHTKVMAVVNQLRQNGEEITDVHVMEEVLRSLNIKFEIIATTIEETQDLKNMTIEQFIGSLQAYEEKRKGEWSKQRPLNNLFNSKSRRRIVRGRGYGGRGHGGRGEANTDVSQNSSESSKGRGGQGRGRRGGRSGRDKSQVKYYNCNKYGHYVNECYSSQTESIDQKHQDRSTVNT